MKKDYLESRRRNDEDAIGQYLSSMGHNVASALMAGRETDYEETLSNTASATDDDHETSSWVPDFENSVLEVFENDNQAYAHRKIGRKEVLPWKNKKCPSCKLGFNTK